MEGPSRSSATLRSEAGPTREIFSGDQDSGFSAEIPETQWQWIELLLETRNTPISDEDRRRLELELTADTCKNYIDTLKTKYGKKGGNKFIKAFEPVIEGLKAYTDGLNTLTKNSAGLSITWGVIQLLLECAMHSYKILGHITKLLENYTHSLKLYMEYAKDFIGHPRLDEALIINFFRGLFWGGKDSRDVEKFMEDLKQCFKIVQKEVSYAKHQRDHAMRRDIQAMAAFQGPSKWYIIQERKGWPEAKMLPTDRRVKYHSRGGEIKQVEHHLNAGKAMSNCNVRVCIIQGVPGLGKTQLALDVACRWEGPVFWLNAKTRVNLKESLSEIATILRLDVEPGMHGQEPSNLAKQWLATYNGWLLVYDNADNFEAMAEVYWPTLSQGSVLVTTRNKDLSIPLHVPDHSISLSLLPMSTNISQKFLKSCLEPYEAEDDDLRQVSILLEGLPLALAHVAECVKAPERHVRDMKHVLEVLQDQDTSIQDIWSIDHRQDPKNLQSWPYERLPREVLDAASYPWGGIVSSRADSVSMGDVLTPLTNRSEGEQRESYPPFEIPSKKLTIDDKELADVHLIAKLDILDQSHGGDEV